jgi:ribonuclease HI
VTLDAVIKVGPLLAGTYAQKTELIALTWVPQLAAGVWVNIYMDSKFAFTTIHVHWTLYKERGLINLGGKNVKYGQEILELLEAVWAPKQVVVMHCWGHQKSETTAV